MDRDGDGWAPLVDRFVDAHYGSLRGRVRTFVIDQHLAEYLPEPPASIVDVGGGAGTQSIPLARRGYEVTIVDSSAAMLERATANLTEEVDSVAARVVLVEARGEDAVDRLGSEVFDAVLCHGVLMYLDDPDPILDSVCELAVPGGLLSMVTKNRANLAVRPALRGDWAEALDAFDATHQVNSFGFNTRADSIEGLSTMLERRGVDPVAWFGVRLFTDRWREAEDDPDELGAALAVELEASRRDPYRQLSRLFHLLGRKREST